jgi:5-carboxymethyl-2-hydroxymuconate isomerase
VPHIVIDYSPNLEDRLDIAGLAGALRDAAVATGVFPLAGIRVRALRADHVVIADGDPGNAYLDILVRLRAGRTAEDKARACGMIFAAAEKFCAGVMETSPFLLSLELRDIDPELSPKASSIRRFLKAGAE